MKIKTKIILSITLILMFIIFTISILFRLNVFDKTKEGNESNIEIINKQVETKLKSGYKLLDINNEGILKSPYIKVEDNKYNINLHDNKDNYINVFNEENITYYECKINEYCFNFDKGSYYFSNKTTTNVVDLDNPNFYVLSSFLRTNKDKIINNTNIKVNYYVNLYHTKNGENIYKLIVIDENLDLYEFNYIRSLNFKRVNTCKISKVLYKQNNNKLINEKIKTDSKLENCKIKVVKATKLIEKYPDGIDLASVLVIKNGSQVQIIIDGYDTNYRDLNAKHLLLWELIKRYANEGYTTFNLGGVSNILLSDNKYAGLNDFKMNFGAYSVEYMGDLEVITNPTLYLLHNNPIKKLIKKKNIV